MTHQIADTVSVSRPSVTVVTAFYKNDATYPAQLEALATQEGAPPFEVVIADNEGSSTLDELIAPFRNRLDIRVVEATGRAGQCHARNVGVAHARADIVALCDADDVVGPTWVAALHSAVRDGDVLATGPLRLDEINPPHVCAAKARLDGLDEVPHPWDQGPFSYLGYREFVFGSNIGVRAASYEELGGMNEDMLGGSEDVDFTWRWLESGRRIEVSPEAFIHYRLRTTPREVMAQQYRYNLAQLGMWDRSRRMGRPVRGMSMRWAIMESLKSPWRLLAARNADEVTQYCVAHTVGGTLGNLRGQLRTRGPWHR